MRLMSVLVCAVTLSIAGPATAGGPADWDYGAGSMKDELNVYTPRFNWTGVSLGAHLGYAEGTGRQTNLTDALGFIDNATNAVGIDGWYGGVTTGYDIQTGNFVFGILADLSGGDIDGFNIPDGNPENDGFRTQIDWFGTVRAKLGYAMNRSLLYATGGLAYGHVEATQGDVAAGVFNPVTGIVQGSETRVGWAAGAGFDYAITNNMIIGLEYLYIDLGGRMNLSQVGAPANVSRIDVDAEMHSARLSLRYKF